MEVKMAWICCKAHTCDEGAHCIWDMTWSHVTRWRRSRLGLAWWTCCKHEGQVRGFEAINHVTGKLEQRLGTDGPRQWWNPSEVKIDEPIRSCDDMKWIISFVMFVGACVASTLEEMKWNAQSKSIFVWHFISPVKGCVEKCNTGLRIYGHTIKRGKLVSISITSATWAI